jgi:hypothetical protein
LDTYAEEIDPPSIAGRIVECSWNKEDQCWVCMRIRADKSTPNDINTYRKVDYQSSLVFLAFAILFFMHSGSM